MGDYDIGGGLWRTMIRASSVNEYFEASNKSTLEAENTTTTNLCVGNKIDGTKLNMY